MSKLKPGKVAIIGCGFVGSASAFALMQSGLFTEMVLLDANHQKAEGEAEDIVHGIPFGRPMQIYAGDYDDVADANYSRCKSEAGRNAAGSGKQKHCNFPVDYSGNYKKRF